MIKFVDEDYEAPVEGEVTEEAAKAALSGKTFKVAQYGWWGDGWEDGYYDDPIPEYTLDDTITFEANGDLSINQGETPHIYNDGIKDGEDYTVEGKGKWSIVTDNGAVMVQFANGGFPLMLAGEDGAAAGSDTYHHGLNAKWNVRSIDDDGIVRLEILQPWSEEHQRMVVFLAPVAK